MPPHQIPSRSLPVKASAEYLRKEAKRFAISLREGPPTSVRKFTNKRATTIRFPLMLSRTKKLDIRDIAPGRIERSAHNPLCADTDIVQISTQGRDLTGRYDRTDVAVRPDQHPVARRDAVGVADVAAHVHNGT